MSGDPEPAADERLNELEIKLAFMEQLVGELNNALATESARVTLLERQIGVLQQRLQSGSVSSPCDPRSEPPPPHY